MRVENESMSGSSLWIRQEANRERSENSEKRK